MADRVRWGILGCARIAINRVLPAMQQVEEAALYAIASRDRQKAESTAKTFGAQRVYDSYTDLLGDPDIEAVYIPLPNHLHKEWSIAAVRAGKHVLCEKPIGLNAQEAREMQRAAQETNRLLLEAFMYRFSLVVQEAIRRLRAGEIGELRSIHSAFSFLITDDPSNIRLQSHAGGGAMYDVGCYCINVLRMFAGREPRMAWAKLIWSPKYGVDIGGAGMLDFGEGLRGTFETGFDARGETYCRVTGTEGILEMPDGFLGRGQEARLVLTKEGRSNTTVVPLIDAYRLELEDMCAAIRGQATPKFGWEPLDANMRVLDACYQADRSGCGVPI